jgi:hypothetical protein
MLFCVWMLKEYLLKLVKTCIEKNMSLMKISKIVIQLLREFEFELVNEEWKVKNH